MPRVSPIQEDFSSGEVSPYFKGRVSADRYKTALDISLNQISLLQGGVTRRPGSKYVSPVKTSSKRTRLIRFEYSTTQAYIIEVGDLYMRFYRNNGRIETAGVPTEIVTTYAEADLFNLKFTQSADVLYITHPLYKTRKLSRFSNTSWSLDIIDFQDGPYLKANLGPYSTRSTAFTLTPGAFAVGTGVTLTTGPSLAVTGAANNGAGLIRLTVATSTIYETNDQAFVAGVTGTVEANGTWRLTKIDATHYDLQGSTFTNAFVGAGTILPGLFASTDVGRHVRMLQGTVWGWVKIATFVDAAHVTVDIQATLTSVVAKATWRLGVWSDTTGYATAVTFHEDRLFFGTKQKIDGSKSGDYENFAPTGLDSVVAADNAVSFSLNDNKVNDIKWMTSDEKGMIVGTAGGEWLVRASTQNEALSPTNIKATPSTYFGSANIQPVQVGKATLFLTPSAKKLREISYFFDVDGFRAPDLSYLSEHITGAGLTQLAYQKEPQSIVWGVRADGALVGMTYERELDNLRVGWHRHILGGVSDAAGTQAIVESVDCIPSSTGARTEVWLIVKRWINGAVVRTVEYLTPLFQDDILQKDAFFVDCGLTYDDPKTITGVTAATPPVVTSNAHGFSNTNRILHSSLIGSNEINNLKFYAANVAANTYELQTAVGTNAVGVGNHAYVSGGYARKLVTTISGLTHLEGQVVSILADGAVLPNQTVTAGAITLPYASAVVQIGLAYNSDGQMLRIEAGAADGTALGKTRRSHRCGFLLHRTLGLKVGTDFVTMNSITGRTSADALGAAPPLFSGIVSDTLEADYDFENQIAWRQSQPLPYTILAVMPHMVTQDRS